MIPKIAWIHWHDPQNMPWLRLKSVSTFREHNPGWDVRLIGTPDDMRGKGLEYAHEADWTWWRMLSQSGGFLVASDAISIAPIPDEWLDAELAVQARGGDVYQFPVLGAVEGNELMRRAEVYCQTNCDARLGYQSFGVDMLRRITNGEVDRFGEVFRIPEQAYCFYDWNQDPYALWSDDGPAKELPADAVGLHWYGGHVESVRKEPGSGPEGTSWLERWATDK